MQCIYASIVPEFYDISRKVERKEWYKNGGFDLD